MYFIFSRDYVVIDTYPSHPTESSEKTSYPTSFNDFYKNLTSSLPGKRGITVILWVVTVYVCSGSDGSTETDSQNNGSSLVSTSLREGRVLETTPFCVKVMDDDPSKGMNGGLRPIPPGMVRSLTRDIKDRILTLLTCRCSDPSVP